MSYRIISIAQTLWHSLKVCILGIMYFVAMVTAVAAIYTLVAVVPALLGPACLLLYTLVGLLGFCIMQAHETIKLKRIARRY